MDVFVKDLLTGLTTRVSLALDGAQGNAHALNLRDSGLSVVVGLHEGSRSREKAEAEGLTVMSVEDAAAKRELAGFACGTYVHDLRRYVEGWKIIRCQFVVAGYATGRAAFDEEILVS